MMSELLKTVLHDKHVALGANLVDFGGWHMPIQYRTGIVEEHLATRKSAGIFDVSHMGRFVFSGSGTVAFLQHVLSNNAAALDTGFSHYTKIPNDRGGALDDAYLYRFMPDEYLLVVNASNLDADWRYLSEELRRFDRVEMKDVSESMAMISLQGPLSQILLQEIMTGGALPEPPKNALGAVTVGQRRILLSRTGYTGEPIGFECFLAAVDAPWFWDLLIEKGAAPVGLGARDTLRLEAGLPLFGHELGTDPTGMEIPIFASPQARFAVSFSPLKGAFVGREALAAQFAALKKIQEQDYSSIGDLPRRIMPFSVRGRGIARPGFRVFRGAEEVGFVTSGTMVPRWNASGEREMRAIGLMLVDSRIRKDDLVEIDIRGKRVEAAVVSCHMRFEKTAMIPAARPTGCITPAAVREYMGLSDWAGCRICPA
jgi:aminomethyltransferase